MYCYMILYTSPCSYVVCTHKQVILFYIHIYTLLQVVYMMVPTSKQHEQLQLLNVFTQNRYAQNLSRSLMRIYVGLWLCVYHYVCKDCSGIFVNKVWYIYDTDTLSVVECENMGGSNEFYDKFSVRYHVSVIIRKLWYQPVHKKFIIEESMLVIMFMYIHIHCKYYIYL